jgi:hypothetical protein
MVRVFLLWRVVVLVFGLSSFDYSSRVAGKCARLALLMSKNEIEWSAALLRRGVAASLLSVLCKVWPLARYT